jgi:hypothetical protein
LVVVVVVAGSSCVDLTRPTLDGGGGRDGSTDSGGEDLADGGDGDTSDAPWEAGRDGATDRNPDVRSTLGDGLVGYWKLDEFAGAAVAADSSMMGNPGQIMGNPGRVTTGLPPVLFKDPGAFSFAGQTDTDDGIQIPDSATLHPAAISIALWVRFASQAASSICGTPNPNSQYLVERRNSRGSAGMFEALALIKKEDGTITFVMYSDVADAGAQAFATSQTALTTQDLGKWFHIVATYDGSTEMHLFVNGVRERTTPYTLPIAYDPGWPFFLGRTGECGLTNGATWDARLNGALDDVRIYNRALTDDEVAQLAAGED